MNFILDSVDISVLSNFSTENMCHFMNRKIKGEQI